MTLRLSDYELPRDLEKYRQAVREFTLTEIETMAQEAERDRRLPDRLLPTLVESGLLRLTVPKEYGGEGLNYCQYWPIFCEAAKTAGAIRVIIHSFNNKWCLFHFRGTEAQKKKYMSQYVKGGFPANAFTEPGAGSGVDLKTTIKRVGDVYRINGVKHLITAADIASVFFVTGYTGDRSLGAKGMSTVLVDAGTPGMTLEPHKEMMGFRGSYHAIITFKDCEVPVTNRVGDEGEGLDIQLRLFMDRSRLSIGVSALASAERLLELSTEYAQKRATFGKPIGQRQGVREMLAEMAMDVYALKSMIASTAEKLDAGKSIAVEAAMCKLFGLEAASRVSDRALLIHGGIGYTSAYAVERFYRDIRAMWLEEGTPNIQKIMIGKTIQGLKPRSVGI